MRSATARIGQALSGQPSVDGRLESARQAIEGRFLEAGDVLAKALEGLGLLISSLDQLSGTLGAESVQGATADLEAAAADLLNVPNQHAERRARILDLVKTGERLADGIDEMRRNLGYLRIFAINIKITVGGIAAAGPEFGDFAQEISDRIEQGRGQLDGFDAALKALRSDFKDALVHEQALSERCEALLPAVPDGLKASAQSIRAHHQRIAKVTDDVASLARDVRKKIGGALAALQIGDITRQRIEHISLMLDLLAAQENLDADQQSRLSSFVHGLAAAQLTATADDFHRDVEKIGAAMAGIAQDAGEILRLKDVAFGGSGDGDKGFLRQLESHVGQALTLVDELGAAERKAGAMGASSAAAASGLNERITELQSIKTDVQQMALNTTLKCGRIGDTGKPLAVIAVELRIYAGHMESSALGALNALNDLSGQAGHLAAGEGEGDRSTHAIGLALSGVSQGLKVAGDDVEKNLNSLARQGEAVVEGLKRAAARLDFRRDIGSILDDAADLFASLSQDPTPPVDDLAEPLGTLLATVAKSYTMAQEREVHARVTQGLNLAAAAPAEPEPAPSASNELDDVLF